MCLGPRRACEQKGSLAAMMAAMRFVGANKVELAADLYFVVSTAGETGRHDSLAHVLDHGKVEADWCIIDGPPEIQLGNKGRVDVLVIVRGKQAHSSRPWEGINAIDGAMRVLEKLKPLMPYPEEKAHPELGKVSLTPNAIDSFPKATHDPERVSNHVRSAASPWRRSEKGHPAAARRHRENRAIRN